MKTSNSQQQLRQALRQEVREKRQALSAHFQQVSAQSLIKQLTTLKWLTSAKKVAIYLANDGELDTSPFINWCWQHAIATYIPVLHPFNPGHLLFLHYHAQSHMKENKYGILEPILNVNTVCPADALDIIFTPLVAFDNTGARLGMGGGYYDRTLANLSSDKPIVIGLAHDCQQLNEIPTEAWDMPVPHIVTPTHHYQFDKPQL
ncbi:5-formyltetrahydrofolate cyclo-ligase [Thalassotalea insulae]|uniref:5-formyltetrahydrofolate cyclo-ligase n=1 Tax=Thalassotalea insulae TaxID=2056778 RepID=A0ABQ6GNI1_9GAMM|nr:5-formyltetrahydrofolate cyclo-ligase [Thalassotalea insulae]GLX77563.1 5-formyltetrahydrofolate cyclo-ligase [Thalassotalea insulae]